MPLEIVELRACDNMDLATQIIDGLSGNVGEKKLPTLLLYDERGLRLYDEITTSAQEYYPFFAEEEILKGKADEIARTMHNDGYTPTGEVVLELGAGALRKTSHILLSLSRLLPTSSSTRPPITYYALDLEKKEIQRTLTDINESIGNSLEGKITIKGMCATYDDGLKFVSSGGLNTEAAHNPHTPSLGTQYDDKDVSVISDSDHSSSDGSTLPTSSPPSTPDEVHEPLHILFLGCSIGNFSRDAAVGFLRMLPLRPGSSDTLLLGLDHNNDKSEIEKAYNDAGGCTERFIINGLRATGIALGDSELFKEANWEYVNQYDDIKRQHEAFYKAKFNHNVRNPLGVIDFSFIKGECIKIEDAFKFSETDAFSLFINSNLRPIQRWSDKTQRHSLWLLERPHFSFPLLKAPTTNQTLFSFPTIQEWQDLWSVWDCVTRRMIPTIMWYQKPIDLRHICLFYLGHIPTFLDIQLSKVLNQPQTEPDHFKVIFERGIDPNVEDPTKCHPHSVVPEKDENWPTELEILRFQARVRTRLLKLYDDINAKKVILTRRIARTLFMTYEHEAMHTETLLYMLLQRSGSGTLPAPGFAVPPWSSLAEAWNKAPSPQSQTVTLGPANISLGHDDLEADDFSTNVDWHEFGWDIESPKRNVQIRKFKISWRPVTNGEFYEFYVGEGSSKVQLPKTWVQDGHELMVRTMYGPVPLKVAERWPVITSYDSLSSYAVVKGGRLPTEPELRLFLEKYDAGYEGGANVGFRNWHPVPATTGCERNGGRGTNGGVWEWTSTVFDKHEGFKPSCLYPGYSTDFFDGVHQVVLGGSYATIPRIAERKTFRNWYQHNYPYAWIGGRIVYDI